MKSKYSRYLDSGQYEKLIEDAAKNLINNPDSFEELAWQGHAYRKLDRFEEARSCYNKVLALKKTSDKKYSEDANTTQGYAEAYIGLGKILARSTDTYQDAINYLQKAIACSPSATEAYKKLADIYRKLNNPDEVIKYTNLADKTIGEREEDNSASVAKSPAGSPEKSSAITELYNKSIENNLADKFNNFKIHQEIDESILNSLKDNLFNAVKENNTQLIKEILAKGINVDVKDEFGATALYVALLHEKKESAEELLKLGANPNAPCRNGITPMHIASQNLDQEMLTLLISYGGKIIVEHDDGGNLLHSVAIGIRNANVEKQEKGYVLIEQLLKDRAIDPFKENNLNNTPRDILDKYDPYLAERFDDLLVKLGGYYEDPSDIV